MSEPLRVATPHDPDPDLTAANFGECLDRDAKSLAIPVSPDEQTDEVVADALGSTKRVAAVAVGAEPVKVDTVRRDRDRNARVVLLELVRYTSRDTGEEPYPRRPIGKPLRGDRHHPRRDAVQRPKSRCAAGRQATRLCQRARVAVLDGHDIRVVRRNRPQRVHELHARPGEGHRDSDEEREQPQRNGPGWDTSRSPVDERPQVGCKLGGEHREVELRVRASDQFGKRTLHAAVVVDPVCHERDPRAPFCRPRLDERLVDRPNGSHE